MAKVTDFTGVDVKLGYDGAGDEPNACVWKWQDQQAAIRQERDEQERVKALKTNWGYAENYAYDSKTAQLKEIVVENAGEQASVQFDAGRPAAICHFDGSITELSYYDAGPNEGALKEIRDPEGVSLSYRYGDNQRLAAVDCAGIYRSQYEYDNAGRLTGMAMTPMEK